jgi:uncharacterized repeat protein (TIGR01451 family)
MKEPDFELSADMRLLELQRGALGLPARERTGWESSTSSSTGMPLAGSNEDDAVAEGALLTVDATAFPNDGVIPGAVVTVTLKIANEGNAAAGGVVAGVPLPGGASYRPGSFVWNGRSSFDDVAEAFIGAGLDIGSIGASERATFEWKIGVKLGMKPLILAPTVRASGAAVIGARPLSIGRKATAGSQFAGELQRADASVFPQKPLFAVDIPANELPIYELDAEEEIVAEAAQSALSTAVPVFPLVAAPEPAPERDPEIEIEPAIEPIAESPPAREAIVLYGRFDRATIAFFERVFLGTKTPTILQHCILAGALACSTGPDGNDSADLKKHLDAQAQVLHRIALHEKLGKKEPISEYGGELLALPGQLRKTTLSTSSAPGDALLLSTELSDPTAAVLLRIAEDPARWDFVKARQLTLALQADSVAKAGLDPALRDDIRSALRGYAQASVQVLQKLFVRMRIDRTTGILLQTDSTLDASARALIGTFKRALP